MNVRIIDIGDLPSEDVELVQEFIDQLRTRKQIQDDESVDAEEMRSWALGVKGNLSRKEIYDYL